MIKPRSGPERKPNNQPPSFQENFKIFLRIKPTPIAQQNTLALRSTGSQSVEVIPPYYSTETERIYEYEEVFDQKASNLEVFERTMSEPIRNVLAGYNSTVFIYGMTGAGKTYTMFNPDSEAEGLVGLSLERLFEQLECHQMQVLLSFFEIYNENIRDLLRENSHPLSIMQNPIKGVFIDELSEQLIKDAPRAKTIILQGLARRSNNATNNNQYSSRSHAILQFKVRNFLPSEGEEVGVRESKLFLIDLAGNEKAGQNENKRFVQGVNINKSLLTLGKCITILAEQPRSAFIPFRDSKLTRILKDSLGGNSKTVMIACVSPEARFYEETLNTLKYSTKARRIKNRGKAASIKLVNRRELPQLSHQDTHEQKLSLFISRLQHLLEQKVRAELMAQQMEECRDQMSEDAPGCQTHKEMQELMTQLSSRQSLLQANIDQEVKKFLHDAGKMLSETTKQKEAASKQELACCKLKLKEQAREIQEMKNILDQRAKLQSLHHTNSSEHPKLPQSIQISSNGQQSKLQPDTPNALRSTTPNILKAGTPTGDKVRSSHILIDQSTGKSQERRRNKVQLGSGKHSNKENISFLNELKRCNTPQSSLHSSKMLKDSNRAKPTINITVDNITLKHKTDEAARQFSGRQGFLKRLQEMEKTTQRFSQQQLTAMVEECQDAGYELNKAQASMLNKLRFMAKSTIVKDPPLKNRSLLK